MALSDRLAIIITANGSQAVSEFNRVGRAAGRSLSQAETRAQKLGATMTRVGATMLTAGAVATVGMFKLAQASEQQRLAEISLQNALNNSPVITNRSTQAYLEQASALQQVTVAGDEEIVAAQARLATFRVTEDQIRGLTPLIVDYARKYGVDLVSAANNVGKAMMGNVGALQRQGVFIDENVYATDRYTAVMQALRENAGGFAEAEGATFTGQLEIMKNRLGELAEGVGAGAVDAFSSLLGAVEGVSSALGGADAAGMRFTGQLLTYGSLGVTAAGALSVVVGGLMRFAGQARAAADAAYMMYLRVRTTPMTFGQIATRVGAASVALAVLAIAYQRSADAQARAQAVSDAFSTGFDNAATAAEGLQNALDQLEGDFNVASGDELQRAFAAIGVSAEEAIDIIQQGGPALDDLVERLAATGEVSEDTRSALEQIGAALAWEDDTTTSIEAVDRVRAALEQAGAELEGFDGRAAEAAFAGTEEGADAAAAAVDDLNAAIDAYLNEITGVSGAQDALEQSFNGLFEALVENGPVFEGMTAGAIANREAFSGLLSDQAALIQSMFETGASTEQMSNALWGSVGRLNQARQAGLITQQQFDFLAQSILNIPITSETTVSTPGLSLAEYQANQFERVLNRLNGRHIGVTIAVSKAWDAVRFASGTPSAPRGVALVGEEGPELVAFRGGEQVFTAAQTDRIMRGTGGGGVRSGAARSGSSGGGVTVNVNVNGPVYGMDDFERKVLESVRRAERMVAA